MRALTAFMSTVIAPPADTPNSGPRRIALAAAALATSVFVGMQPVLTQVPPKDARSRMATFIPDAESRAARAGPAWPVPMTIASYVLLIAPLPSYRSRGRRERLRATRRAAW